VRSMLTSGIHSLVAALLVVSLVLGTTCLIIFLSLRIGQESSAAVIAARDAARDWTTSLPASNDSIVPQKVAPCHSTPAVNPFTPHFWARHLLPG